MLDFKIDGAIVDINEDISTEKISHSIKNDKFITTKIFKKTVSTKIYTYNNGVSVCFKLDDSGANEFFEILFVIMQKQVEKTVLTVPRTASIEIDKVDDEHFLIFMSDDINNENTLTFVTIKNKEQIQLCTLNATKIYQKDVINNKYLLFSSVEKLEEKKFLYVVAVYDLSGVAIEHIVDKELNKEIVYKFGNFKKNTVFYGIEKKNKIKKMGKYVFPEEITSVELVRDDALNKVSLNIDAATDNSKTNENDDAEIKKEDDENKNATKINKEEGTDANIKTESKNDEIKDDLENQTSENAETILNEDDKTDKSNSSATKAKENNPSAEDNAQNEQSAKNENVDNNAKLENNENSQNQAENFDNNTNFSVNVENSAANVQNNTANENYVANANNNQMQNNLSYQNAGMAQNQYYQDSGNAGYNQNAANSVQNGYMQNNQPLKSVPNNYVQNGQNAANFMMNNSNMNMQNNQNGQGNMANYANNQNINYVNNQNMNNTNFQNGNFGNNQNGNNGINQNNGFNN